MFPQPYHDLNYTNYRLEKVKMLVVQPTATQSMGTAVKVIITVLNAHLKNHSGFS